MYVFTGQTIVEVNANATVEHPAAVTVDIVDQKVKPAIASGSSVVYQTPAGYQVMFFLCIQNILYKNL